MNILVKYRNEYIKNNLKELKLGNFDEIFLTNKEEKAIKIINEHDISKVIIEIDDLEEVNFLAYVNKYFPKVKVTILTDTYNEHIFSAIKEGIFAILEQPWNFRKIFAE